MDAIAKTFDAEKAVTVSETSISSSASSKYEVDLTSPLYWSRTKKLRTAGTICLYSFVVYIGSTMVLGLYPMFMVENNISLLTASLSLALYALGYGVGALLFSPLQDFYSIGRTRPYQISFILFVFLTLGTALSIHHWKVFLVLRFFQGFMGSPALATGGATMRDMYDLSSISFSLAAWILGAASAPAIGPMISFYSVFNHSVEWPMYIMLGLSLLTLPLMLTIPETLPAKIAYDMCPPTTASTTRSESSKLLFSSILTSLNKPTMIMLKNPAIAFAAFYICLVYAIFYSFFECFHLVFTGAYGMPYPGVSVLCVSLAIGSILGMACMLPWAVWWRKNFWAMEEETRPERCLWPGVYGSVLISAGMFMFAATAKPTFHYLIPLLGIVIQGAGVFLTMHALCNYVLLAYSKDAASLLAAGDFTRSTLAFAAILFSNPMYKHLGVAKGVYILASLTVACIGGMIWLLRNGRALREKGEDFDKEAKAIQT